MNGNNVINVRKIRREGFTEYRVEVSSAFTMPDFESRIPDEFVAAKFVNQLREFVNASVLGECIEVAYIKLEKCELTDDELELLDAMPALKNLAMKAGLI